MLIIGHRGAPSIKHENTIASFQAALNHNVDGLEFDIRLSKDKQIIIFHDATLKRLSNQTEKVSDKKCQYNCPKISISISQKRSIKLIFVVELKLKSFLKWLNLLINFYQIYHLKNSKIYILNC